MIIVASVVALVEINGGTLAAFIVLILAIVVVLAVGIRLFVRDPRIRVARFGVFIERERLDDPHEDEEQERKEDP